MNHPEGRGRREPRSWKAWLIGVPLALVLGVGAVLVWGGLQPKPEGFSVVDSDGVEATGDLESSTTVPEEPGGVQLPEEEPEKPRDEVIRHTLDATSTEDWVLFDFAEGRVVEGDLGSLDWDVAFRRTKLLTNSGVTNPDGPGGAVDLGETPLEEATLPSEVVFVVDSLGGDDGDEPENLAAGRWYTYSFMTHIVSVKPNTYLIRTGDDHDALVQFDSYYCEDEESGCVTFRYRLVPAVAAQGA